jgi:hypothetical protein
MNQQILNAIRIEAVDTAKAGGWFTSNPFKISINNKEGKSRSEVVISCAINNGGSASSTEDPDDFDTIWGNPSKQLTIEDFVAAVLDVNVDILKRSE